MCELSMTKKMKQSTRKIIAFFTHPCVTILRHHKGPLLQLETFNGKDEMRGAITEGCGQSGELVLWLEKLSSKVTTNRMIIRENQRNLLNVEYFGFLVLCKLLLKSENEVFIIKLTYV